MVVFKLTPYLLQILQFTSKGAVNALAVSMAYGSSKQCIKNMKAEEGDSLGILFCTSFSSCDIEENAHFMKSIQIRPFLLSKEMRVIQQGILVSEAFQLKQRFLNIILYLGKYNA